MPKSSKKLTTDQLGQLIYEIRHERVMLDSDLASIYGVETKALNRAVKRNADRFPRDFMFQISVDEWQNLKYHFTKCDGHNRSTSSARTTEAPYWFYTVTDRRSRITALAMRALPVAPKRAKAD